MRFEGHYIITVFISLVVAVYYDPRIAILIGLAHFIPSIDWIMKRLDVFYHHHRKLVHNIFVIPLSYLVFYLLTKDLVIPVFCALSTTLHLAIDYMDKEHRGVALFFPFSQKRYKLPLMSDKVDNTVVNIAFVGTLVIAVVLALR